VLAAARMNVVLGGEAVDTGSTREKRPLSVEGGRRVMEGGRREVEGGRRVVEGGRRVRREVGECGGR
jgi:hypothetical protein